MRRFVHAAACVFLALFAASQAHATTITIQSTTINGWAHPDTAPRLRIFVNKPVVTSDSQILEAGSWQQGIFYKAVICSVSGGVLTIPQFTIDSLTDALVGSDAKYSAYFYTAAGQQIAPYRGFEAFSVPAAPTITTHAGLLQFNLAAVPHIDGLTFNRTQILSMVASLNPLTTKGDLFTFGNSGSARLPVGGDGTVPIADSAAPLGIRWGTPSGGQWGQISGTLSNQTDLQAALNAKQSALTFGNLTPGANLSVTGGAGAVIGPGAQVSLGPNVVTGVSNDLNITGSISSNLLSLGFAGALSKSRQHSATAYTDQANNWGLFVQTFQAGANHVLVDPVDAPRNNTAETPPCTDTSAA